MRLTVGAVQIKRWIIPLVYRWPRARWAGPLDQVAFIVWDPVKPVIHSIDSVSSFHVVVIPQSD